MIARPARGALVFLPMLGAALAACGGAAPAARGPEAPATYGELADEERLAPPYGRAELTRALIAERGAEATGERIVAELEAREPGDAAADARLRAAVADLGVRRRFIAALEACEASGRWCPPRLDEPAWAYELDADPPRDPPLDAPLRFDAASWRQIAAELHGRACACRTLACVDSLDAAIGALEARPMPDVAGDEAASRSLTRARECLFRLRGKALRRPGAGGSGGEP